MGAHFDVNGLYRYSLWREWSSAPRIAFVMLNPSTADASQDDPTIRRCVQFAKQWGYGSLEVVNLFAYRATDPRRLQQVDDPVGDDNDRALVAAAQRAALLLIAWGNWGRLYGRDRHVLNLLTSTHPVYCLGINQSGQPRHPLYVPADAQPVLFQPRLPYVHSALRKITSSFAVPQTPHHIKSNSQTGSAVQSQ